MLPSSNQYLPVDVIVAVVEVVTLFLQLPGSLFNGGLLGPELHLCQAPWQGFLSGGQEECRWHAFGEDE